MSAIRHSFGRIVAYGEKCRRQIRNAKSIQCTA
jgi:hypothetical protein